MQASFPTMTHSHISNTQAMSKLTSSWTLALPLPSLLLLLLLL
jgi:hypothetical protein